MNITTLAVLLLVLALLIAVKTIGGFRPFMTWKNYLVIGGVYLAGLLVLVPMLYFLPDEGFKSVTEDMGRWESGTGGLSEFARGNLDAQSGVYQNSSIAFEFAGDKVGLKITDSAMNNNVFIERKDVDDGTIEVITFTTPNTINDIDFTEFVYPPDISLQGNTLIISQDKKQSLEFSQFRADFTLDQFKHVNVSSNEVTTSVGWQVVYIRIPQSLEVDTGNYNVTLVHKD